MFIEQSKFSTRLRLKEFPKTVSAERWLAESCTKSDLWRRRPKKQMGRCQRCGNLRWCADQLTSWCTQAMCKKIANKQVCGQPLYFIIHVITYFTHIATSSAIY